MPKPFPVRITASRTEIVEFVIEITADTGREAESLGLSEGRKLLRQGQITSGWTRRANPWHVIDAVPIVKADGSPHPG